ncbi:EamA family transporter [uncultured Actinomyces sp.]|uniref:EamA family transporter n=1 Tax=uncultured Actinomyces sp. TaxID=249061 RepID=UPI0025EAACF4|nr:EamA family transporter [uncultured Actinomyces sp.]
MTSLRLRFSILRWHHRCICEAWNPRPRFNAYLFLFLSGLATGASRLCYYRAFQEGSASIVVPIDKLSILVAVVFSALMLCEHVSGRYSFGIASMCTGVILMVIG